MKWLSTALVVVFLTACNTVVPPIVVMGIKQSCTMFKDNYPTFLALVEAGVIKGRAAEVGDDAADIIEPICKIPENATYADVLSASAQALILYKIVKEAR